MTKTRQKKPPLRSSSRSASPWLSLARTGANLNVEDFLTFRITRLSNALRTNLTKRYLEAGIARFVPSAEIARLLAPS